MQLAILLVVVAALAGIGPPRLPPDHTLWRTLVALALASVAPLASLLGHAALARELARSGSECERWQQRLKHLQTLITCLWAGGSLVIIYGIGWPEVVRAELPAWPLVDELAILAPLVASLVAIWAAAHQVEAAAGRAAAAQRGVAPPPSDLSRYVGLHVRQYLALLLVPTLAILGIQETAMLLFPGGAQAAWWTVLAGVAAIVLVPLLLAHFWQAMPLREGPLKERLVRACREIGCPVQAIYLWRTDGYVSNAIVAGLLPGLRLILLSDGLVARLDDDEIEIVVRHEASHLARRHLAQRLLLLALPLTTYGALAATWPELMPQLERSLAGVGIGPHVQGTVLVPLAAVAYALVAVGWLSRWHEHDADVLACSEGPGGKLSPAAVGRLESALVKLVGQGPERRRRGWMHPSVDERAGFLRRLAQTPELAAGFFLRQRLVIGLLVAGSIAALAVVLWPR